MEGIILSIITFVLGILFSYLIARTTEIKTNITVKFQNIGIINNELEDVTFSCNGCKISTLIKTSILFWNSGRKCITKEQLVDEKLLHFVFPDECHIFSSKIIKTTNESINLNCKVKDNDVFIDFAYLKKGDGGLIEILHNSDKYENIEAKIKLNSNQKKDVIVYKHSTDWFTIDNEKAFKRKIVNFSIIALSVVSILILSIAVLAISVRLTGFMGDKAIIIFIIGEWLVGFLSSKIKNMIDGKIINVPNKLR